MIAAGEKIQAYSRDGYPYNLQMDEPRHQTMAFSHGDLLFVFNWHPLGLDTQLRSTGTGSGPVTRPILSTDERRFGGHGADRHAGAEHFSLPRAGRDERPRIRIYNTSRTATVFLREE